MNAKKAKMLRKWSSLISPFHGYYKRNKDFYNNLDLKNRILMTEEMTRRIRRENLGLQEVLPKAV
jgi:hypothetical protein